MRANRKWKWRIQHRMQSFAEGGMRCSITGAKENENAERRRHYWLVKCNMFDIDMQISHYQDLNLVGKRNGKFDFRMKTNIRISKSSECSCL